jgi:hypothetical protein
MTNGYHTSDTLKSATFLRKQESSRNKWIPCQARNVSQKIGKLFMITDT